MPRIRMRTLAASSRGYLEPGKIYELPADEADVFLAARVAELVEKPAERSGPAVAQRVPVETAALDASDENAAERIGRTRRSRG